MSNGKKWALGILGAVASWAIVLFVWFYATQPAPVTEDLPPGAKSIVLDAEWYQVLWMRWTVTDWFFGLLAAGTAVTAAVKNAFSSHNSTIGGTTGSASTQFDRAVMLFAALSVVATTLDAKMHPAQLAERYRQGDLLLQDAIMDYRLSTKSDDDLDTLRVTWHQAQKILEGAPAVSAQPNAKLKTPDQLHPLPEAAKPGVPPALAPRK
jgi:hypothetical protein